MARFIPNTRAGTRRDTAVLLIGTAREFGIDVHEVRTTMNRTGFTISDRLAAIIDAEQAETSGNRAEKKDHNSQKGN